eukprot:6491578-Amphidinium_carterae.2
MSNFQLQRMKVSDAPDEEVASGFFVVADPTNKRSKELDTDTHKGDHYRNDVIMIEKDARYASGSGKDSRRRKSRRTIRAGGEILRKEGQMDGTLNGVHLHLGFFDKRDMVPVKRTSTAWNMYTKNDAINVGNYKPSQPPPAGSSSPGYWNTEESLKEKDPIPSWALEMKAPSAPIVYNAETSFAESAPLKEYEEFDGHAAIKKGSPCYLCREVTFLSGLAWRYCKAGPAIEDANCTRYDLKKVLPKKTDVNQVLQLQKVKVSNVRGILILKVQPVVNCSRCPASRLPEFTAVTTPTVVVDMVAFSSRSVNKEALEREASILCRSRNLTKSMLETHQKCVCVSMSLRRPCGMQARDLINFVLLGDIDDILLDLLVTDVPEASAFPTCVTSLSDPSQARRNDFSDFQWLLPLEHLEQVELKPVGLVCSARLSVTALVPVFDVALDYEELSRAENRTLSQMGVTELSQVGLLELWTAHSSWNVHDQLAAVS